MKPQTINKTEKGNGNTHTQKKSEHCFGHQL